MDKKWDACVRSGQVTRADVHAHLWEATLLCGLRKALQSVTLSRCHR